MNTDLNGGSVFVAVIEDRSDVFCPKITTMVFNVAMNIDNPEDAIRVAVKEYLSTQFGKQDVHSNNGYFNWGDVAIRMGAEDFKKFGLTPIPSVGVLLDHDEDLVNYWEG